MKTKILSTGIRWFWLACLVSLADIFSKFWVIQNFQLYESVKLLPFFNFTYVHNYGAAFSSFLGQRWALAIIAISIIIILLVMMYRSSATEKLINSAFALIIGGALGNLFDRLHYGYVVDFLHFYIKDWHYPIFNIADIAICIGAGFILLDGILSTSKKDKKQ